MASVFRSDLDRIAFIEEELRNSPISSAVDTALRRIGWGGKKRGFTVLPSVTDLQAALETP